MAVATIDPIVTNVVLVTELNRLLALDKSSRVVGRALNLGQRPSGASYDENGSKYAHFGKCVRTAMENLRHSLSLSSGVSKRQTGLLDLALAGNRQPLENRVEEL